jgi:hypothetical protein
MSTVLDEIGAERAHQIAKGFTADHDDGHAGELLYAHPWGAEARLDRALVATSSTLRRRLLVEAAALIVAEIERHDRAEARR